MSPKSWQNSQMKRPAGTTCTDSVLLDVFNSMLTDFNNLENTDIYNRYRCKSVKDVRKLTYPSVTHIKKSSIVKQECQVKSFFSRYVSDNDLHSDVEVEKRTFASYCADNLRISTLLDFDTPFTNKVLRVARRKAREILGTVTKEEIYENVRFGRKASIGIPNRKSYLDNKMKYPITCDPKLCKTFAEVVAADPCMSRVFSDVQNKDLPYLVSRDGLMSIPDGEQPPVFTHTRSVKLSLVPKKFDKLRPVTPYSTASVMLSLACGEVMSSRLDAYGLDITRLQHQHQNMVRWMSVFKNYVTADLSAASNSLTWRHIRRVIPSNWYAIIRHFQVRNFTYCPSWITDPKMVEKMTQRHHTETFLGMGSGLTFPLQTLIFYCIIDAVRELMGVKNGSCSVYGDDLIYPRRIHKVICSLFPKLGFKLNMDKTYCDDSFRESCGEDCHDGLSVRPFSFEGSTNHLRGAALGSFLFKLYNGILLRWKESDLPITFHTLKRWISASYGKFHIVPANYPETSGYRSRTPHNYEEWYVPVTVPIWLSRKSKAKTDVVDHNRYYGWCFHHLQDVSEDRIVSSVYPYLWEWLRVKNSPQKTYNPYQDDEDNAVLRWISLNNEKTNVRLYHKQPQPSQDGIAVKIQKKKVKKLFPVVTLKNSAATKLKIATVFGWDTVST